MEETKIEKPINYTACCDVLEKMDIGWMKIGKNVKCMPYIKDHNGEILYRVNCCPSCGKYIRDIILEDKQDGK